MRAPPDLPSTAPAGDTAPAYPTSLGVDCYTGAKTQVFPMLGFEI